MLKPWHYWILVVFTLVFTALSVLSAAKIQQTVPEWFASFTSNLAAGFLGAFITAFFIDRIIQRERREEKDRAQEVALTLLRPPLLRHLGLLADWYKAAAPYKPVELPRNISGIFTPEYYEAVRNLDFSKKGPCAPPATWIRWSVERLDDLRAEISSIIDKYAVFMESDFLRRLEDLRGSVLINILIWHQHDANVGNILGRILDVSNQPSKLVEEHVNCFTGVLDWYNTHANNPITLETMALWNDNTAPNWGSARSIAN